ncbi:MAG: ABC transporter permease [Vicinamibacterales bacterium]
MTWRRFFRRATWDRERAEELASYLDLETDDNIARGMSPEEARRAAHLKLGNRLRIREQVYQMNSVVWLDSLVQDVRYTARTLWRAPLFAATVVLTIGLGLGLAGSAFAIFNAYLFRPVDLPNPRALHLLIWETEAARRQRFRLTDYEALRPEASRFAELTATQSAAYREDAVTTPGLLVTGNYFELIGARPALGRLLRPDDAAARGTKPVVVLTYNAWRSRYGANPAIVGQLVQLGRQRFEVVGVAQPGANLAGQELVSFYAPLTMAGTFGGDDPWSESGPASLVVIARLRPDVSAASMQPWLESWLRQRFPPPSDAAPAEVRLDSLATRLPLDGDAVAMLTIIMSIFGLVLLVATANITNLMLARALSRQAEIVVRLALGAGRWRVVRQLIVESLMLAMPAAAAGLAFVTVVARVLPSVLVASWPAGAPPVENRLVPLDPDVRVIAFLAAAAVVSAVLIMLAPAGRLTSVRLVSASRGQASSDARGSRLRSGLVALQIGACVLFLVAALGLVDQSSRLANPPLDLAYDQVSILQADLAVRAKVAARLPLEAAVQQVAVSWRPPLGFSLRNTAVTASASNITAEVGYTGVSAEYFPLFDIRIVRGRSFTPSEAAARAAVVVVSQATAQALWPGLDPLGQTLDLTASSARRPDRALPRGRVQVIGVAEDVANGSMTDGIDVSCVYFPIDARGPEDMTLLVRARSDDAAALRTAATAAVNDVAPDAPFRLMSMRSMVAEGAWGFRILSAVASLLGFIGLLFAYSGTHAVVSFLVAQRTREFGVRMALGASGGRIVWEMLTQTSRTAAIGLVAGVAVAAGLLRLLAASAPLLEFGVRPFAIGAAVVLGATMVAALVPLRAAARIDPVEALRAE